MIPQTPDLSLANGDDSTTTAEGQFSDISLLRALLRLLRATKIGDEDASSDVTALI